MRIPPSQDAAVEAPLIHDAKNRPGVPGLFFSHFPSFSIRKSPIKRQLGIFSMPIRFMNSPRA